MLKQSIDRPPIFYLQNKLIFEIVLGGGVAKGLAPYLSRLFDTDLLGPYKGYQTSITISELEEQAGILGAAVLLAQTA
ncbi:hypothetical protein [Haliscomenobacter sp.]|uniref:hypothetical protein n=1 Tax=Haliscomenobacter sp. TaxID=2717303 RepID=UPI003364F1BF